MSFQFSERLPGLDEIVQSKFGADQKLQCGRALGPVLRREFSQIAIGQLRGGLEVAAIEMDHRAPERCDGIG
jgi:hypothetical protein